MSDGTAIGRTARSIDAVATARADTLLQSSVRPRRGDTIYDPGNGQLRYLVHDDDGGSGMRTRDEPHEPGVELVDGGSRYRVVRVQPAPNPQALGHVWAELIER